MNRNKSCRVASLCSPVTTHAHNSRDSHALGRVDDILGRHETCPRLTHPKKKEDPAAVGYLRIISLCAITDMGYGLFMDIIFYLSMPLLDLNQSVFESITCCINHVSGILRICLQVAMW